MNILVNGKEYPLEVKVTQKSKAQGMMGRNKLNGGMLFIFDKPQTHSFWMKDCLVLLDIVFLRGNTITTIHHSCEPCDKEECERYEGTGDAVLEFLGGFCRDNNLNEGDQVEFLH